MEKLPSYKSLNRARKILELPEMATVEEIKSAYYRLVEMYHPDRCAEKDKAYCTKKMAEINNAYGILMTYIQNYRYIFTEEAYREQDMEYAVKRFFKPENYKER
ncbi:MAG: DnaJ domain-containing protein [bacterium]